VLEVLALEVRVRDEAARRLERSGETKWREPLARGDDGVGSGQGFIAHPGIIPATDEATGAKIKGSEPLKRSPLQINHLAFKGSDPLIP